jgi:Tol biopolymer transport system component
MVGGALTVLLLGAGTVAALPGVVNDLPKPLANVARLPERLWAQAFPPRVPKKARLTGLTVSEQAAVRELGRRLDGLLLWSSNRDGHHQLYLIDLRQESVKRLTSSPHVNSFSRFSPDGRQIVFARSQQEYVTFRDATRWDLFVIGADGAGERRIVQGGYRPTWTPDGKAVIFYRDLAAVRYDLATRQETVLFDARKDLPGTEEIGDFEVGPDGHRLAFSVRGTYPGHGAFPGAVVYDLEKRTVAILTREQACQTTWARDGQSLVWMETGGNGGTRLMTGAPDGTGRRVFMDLPGAYSHEYFPKLSNDGRWLVWGAAAEGHEHDRADYDIFVWPVGTPASEAVRLTHHPGNDNWPDLWVRPRG